MADAEEREEGVPMFTSAPLIAGYAHAASRHHTIRHNLVSDE